MGRKLKLVAGMVGAISFAVGAWPLGAMCLLYLLVALWPRGLGHLSKRQTLSMVSFMVAAVAAASGGTASPFVFFVSGVVLLVWPRIFRGLRLDDLVPLTDSVLLRGSVNPFSWAALAEVKPGSEEFSRSASAFGGRLMVFTDTGKVYCVAKCLAPGRMEAESKIIDTFRQAAWTAHTGAYLLPLEANQAAEVLRHRLSGTRSSKRFLQAASSVSGVIVLDCERGTVRRASVFDIAGRTARPRLPDGSDEIETHPLVWEVFDTVGKRTGWPQPDSTSDLLSSMIATRGVPIGERVGGLETTEANVTIRTLSGAEVTTTRAQFRAVVSIYF